MSPKSCVMSKTCVQARQMSTAVTYIPNMSQKTHRKSKTNIQACHIYVKCQKCHTKRAECQKSMSNVNRRHIKNVKFQKCHTNRAAFQKLVFKLVKYQ